MEEAPDASDSPSGLPADGGLAAERVAFEGKAHRRHKQAETERRPTGPDGDGRQPDEPGARVPQLMQELDRARETSGKHRRGFLELQGLLEDERLASAHQAEAFTRQIHNLRAQLRSAQAETDGLGEEKAGELARAREELRAAREEALLLQQAAEEAAAERENDIASLQEELGRRRAELRRLNDDARRSEPESAAPRGRIGGDGPTREGHADPLKEKCRTLREECRALKEDNRRLSERLQLLRGRRTSPSAYLAPKEEEAGTQGGLGTETPADEVVSESHTTAGRADASIRKNGGGEMVSLGEQLKRAEEKARQVQRECDALKSELRELQELYDGSQRERRQLEEELGRCKAELEKLAGGDPE